MRQTKIFGILAIFLLLTVIPSVDASITVKTDKFTYNQGETITFTIKNTNSYTINFDGITIKNIRTGETVNTATWCSPDPNAVCPAVVPDPIILNSGEIYTTTWYLNTKGIYRAYIDWWSEGTVTCMAIGCPEPESGHHGRASSGSFRIR